jgi:hypothetical protein
MLSIYIVRIGILYMGNDTTQIWGGGVISYYLQGAFQALGHEAWRFPAGAASGWDELLSRTTDLVIAHGVPSGMIPARVWEKAGAVVFWWLSELFYRRENIVDSPFHGVATNSKRAARWLASRKPAKFIELAADVSLAAAPRKSEYESFATYLGVYPHKSPEQMDLLFRPVAKAGLTLWGRGWESSPYREHARGTLPLQEIGSLYRSAQAVLALTEERQAKRGMLNNRIFEALAAGAVVVSDQFPSLRRHELGKFISFAETPAAARKLFAAIRDDPRFRERALQGQQVVLQRHTYRQRAEEFLAFYAELSNSGQPYSDAARVNP